MTRLIRIAILTLIALWLLAGCAPFIRIEQPANTSLIRLENGKMIGQTFTAGYRGLNGVAIFLKPDVQGDGQLVFHLQEAGTPGSGQELASTSLSLERVQQPGFYRLDFAPQQDSTHHDYYFWFEIQGNGNLLTARGPAEVYLDGALYMNHEPQDAQLTFRLAYDRIQAVQGLLYEGGNWLVLLGLALLLFLLPGWALLSFCLPDWNQLWWAVQAGLSVGVSLAIYPVLLLWTNLVGLHLGVWYAWLPPLFGVGGLIWRFRRRPLRMPDLRRIHPAWLPDLAMVSLLALLMFIRMWVMRGLVVPMWGDSYQHTMITQLMVDHNGLFNTWLPYSPSQSFTYHFGFHSLAAAFHWMSRLPVNQATLWAGQLVNIFAVLALVPLASRIGRSRWAGVTAVFVAGFLLTLPQIYINWGRYTQLAGQVILPVAAYLGWVLLSDSRFQKRQIAVVGLVMGGLALTHYRVLVFGGLFFVVAYLIEFSRRTAVQLAGRILQAGAIAMILFLPWFVRIFSGTLLSLFAAQVSTPSTQVGTAIQEFNTIGSIFNFMPPWLWLILLLVAGWGLWRREKGAALIAFWWTLNLLSANPQWLHLPGTGAIGSFTVMIACYIPAALLIGGALGWTFVPMPASTQTEPHLPASILRPGVSFLLLIVAIGAGMWTARQRINDVDTFGSTLFTRADQRAATWIRANVPQEKVFLVNSFLAYSGTLAVGSDGGWWLPLQASRQTTLPPINYDTEAGPRPDYTAWVNQLTATLQQKGLDDRDSLDLLKDHNVTHVYIGQRNGSVNSPGPLFTAEQLIENAHFKLLYHQDRVWIFSFLGP